MKIILTVTKLWLVIWLRFLLQVSLRTKGWLLLFVFSLDGQPCEGGNVTEPSSGTATDRPLTQTSNPVSYAGSVRRPESSAENTPPRHYSGKPKTSPSPVSTQPSTSPWRLESYATVLQQGKSGPQAMGIDGVSEIDIILEGIGNNSPCTTAIYHWPKSIPNHHCKERRTHHINELLYIWKFALLVS